MRLDDAERESLLEQLSEHAAAGSIELDELERRVEHVARAQSREEALAALSDLPPLRAPRAPAARGRRGHGHSDSPQPDWRPTGERFRDPASGRVMRVWLDPSGARHYVVD